jgi:excisionase family DNA binding protein
VVAHEARAAAVEVCEQDRCLEVGFDVIPLASNFFALLDELALPHPEVLITGPEVAERLGVRTDWVWAQARAGRIPHVRLGRYRRFRESALEAWLCGLEADSIAPRAARSAASDAARSAFASTN